MVTTEFIVNEKKRTVVCIITTVDDFITRIEKYGLGDDKYDDMEDVRVYKGIAKCCPQDTWDESYGRKLAEWRAERQRQVDINNEIYDYTWSMRDRLVTLETYGMLKEPTPPRGYRRNWEKDPEIEAANKGMV